MHPAITAGGVVSRTLRAWLPVAVWIAVIAVLSTDVASRSSTEGGLADFFEQWFPALADTLRSSDAVGVLIVLARKLGHLLEYGVLGLLAARAVESAKWAGTQHVPATRVRAVLIVVLAVGLAAGVAALDELHQSTVATRTGSPFDVALDTAGAVIGSSVWLVLRRRTV